MPKRRLLWRLFPSYLLITALALLAIGLYGWHSLRQFYYDQVADDLKARAQLLENQLVPILLQRDFEAIDDLCKKMGAATGTRVTVVLPNGQVIADSDEDPQLMENHSDRPELIQALNEGRGRSLRFSSTLGKKMMYVALPVKHAGQNLALIRTSLPVTAIDRQLGRVYTRIIWSLLVVVAITAAISLVVSRKLSRPIEQMTATAKRFAAGELDLRLPVPDSRDLGDLAEALNEMAKQLSNRINAITRQRNESEAILASMVEGVLAVDITGHVVRANKAATSLLKIDPADIQGRNIEEVVRDPELLDFIKQTLDGREPAERGVFLQVNGGKYFQLHGARLPVGQGGSGAVIVLNDMTRLRRLEEVRRDFVANVSHELKTPVTSIKGFIETLLEGAIDEPSRAKRFLEIIAKHSDRLNAIVDDLLSLSCLEEDTEASRISFEEKPLMDVIGSAVELASPKAQEKQINVTLDCDKDIKLKMNSALLEQAILNLVDNAIKYSDSGNEVRIKAQQEGEEITIMVHDNGCGIDKRHLERIFERFYVVDKGRSRKLGGTGLGLAIVKHIAQVHGGSVSVQSKVGSGSTFTIHLSAS